MKNISPSFKVQCSSFIFKAMALGNDVLIELIDEYVYRQKKIAKKPMTALEMNDMKELAVKKIVSKLQINLTMPEDVIVKQEDPPTITNGEEMDEPAMFFIAKGSCDVMIKTSNVLEITSADNENKEASEKKVRKLYEGDHFGEIGLIYNCMRSATVTSNNYCTLAELRKSDYNDISEQFMNLTNKFKNQIHLYDDELKIFLEKEMNKVPYFEPLSIHTKTELLFSMER